MFQKIKFFIPFFIVGLTGIQCNFLRKEETAAPNVIARAYDKNLYDTDLLNIVPKGTSRNDSVTIISNYINNWLKQQVVLKKAEDNLTERQKEVNKQLEEYRNSLITYIYERELINQKLDTTVSEPEVEQYYNDHQANFQLKDNIIKVKYVLVPANAPKLDKVRLWYKSENEKDKTLLQDYCHQFAKDYYFNDQEWLPFDDLLKKVPISTYDKEAYLRNNRFIEVMDTNGIYFVNISGFKIKESISPLSFEKDNIRALIINKRKLELIDRMEKDTYNEALRQNEIKIYDTRK